MTLYYVYHLNRFRHHNQLDYLVLWTLWR